jgi:mannose-6-phosphate isomerase-like protein (cupin superfamily)
MSDETDSIEQVMDTNGVSVLALIIPAAHRNPGINFVTEDESVHQVGVLCWPQGHVIDAHVHNPLERQIDSTQEVLFIRNGKARLDLYSASREYQCSRELNTGDVVFLPSGGHGLEMLEDTDIIEVKQGPYRGESEKTRFIPTDNPHWTGHDAH